MIFSKLLISCCDWEKMNGIHLLEESQKCDKKNLVIEPNQLLWIYNTASRYVFIYNDHSISTLKIWKIPYKNLTNFYQKNHWFHNRISWLRSKLDGPFLTIFSSSLRPSTFLYQDRSLCIHLWTAQFDRWPSSLVFWTVQLNPDAPSTLTQDHPL